MPVPRSYMEARVRDLMREQEHMRARLHGMHSEIVDKFFVRDAVADSVRRRVFRGIEDRINMVISPVWWPIRWGALGGNENDFRELHW